MLFVDSFDHYTAPDDCMKKWTSLTAGATALVAGRNDRGLQLGSGISGGVIKGLAQRSYLVTGFAFKCAATVANVIAEFWDVGYCQLVANLTAAGAIELRAFNTAPGTGGSVLLATSDPVISAGTWYYIEMKGYLDDSAGLFEVRVDGNVVVTYTGDTRRALNSPYTLLAGVALGNYQPITAAGSTRTFYYDDFYVLDTLGTENNDYLGDCRIACLWPNGEGNTQQWTPLGGGTHYTEVDEALLDSDTSYEYSATYPQKTLYQFQDLSGIVGSIAAIQTAAATRKTSTGGATFHHTVRSNSTDTDGDAKAFAGGANYNYSTQIWESDPSDSLPWTRAKVDAVEAGINRTA